MKDAVCDTHGEIQAAFLCIRGSATTNGTSEAIANLQGVSSTPRNRLALTNFGLRKTDIVWRELSCTDFLTKIGA